MVCWGGERDSLRCVQYWVMTAESPKTVDGFTWDNLPADHYFLQQATTVVRFMEDVVRPSIDALDRRINELSTQRDFVAVFQLPEFEALKQTSIQAFMLSLHSIWERQLRAYLDGCIRSKKDGVGSEAVRKADWEALQKLFQQLRGIDLKAFDSFDALDTAQFLASACRHGDGRAAKALFKRWPECWPNLYAMPCPLHVGLDTPPFNRARLSLAILEWVAQAVCWFWDDHEYIRCGSLASKDPFVLEQLEHWRKERKGRNLARPEVVHC